MLCLSSLNEQNERVFFYIPHNKKKDSKPKGVIGGKKRLSCLFLVSAFPRSVEE